MEFELSSLEWLVLLLVTLTVFMSIRFISLPSYLLLKDKIARTNRVSTESFVRPVLLIMLLKIRLRVGSDDGEDCHSLF